MKILGERVLLDWEVFNWHRYMGCSYIRIASPISREFTKICSVPSALENKWESNPEHMLASFFHLARVGTGLCQEIDRGCCLWHINIFHTQQFEQFPRRLLSCNCRVVVCCVVVTMREAQPVDELVAPGHLCCLLSPRSSTSSVELNCPASPYTFAFFPLVD